MFRFSPAGVWECDEGRLASHLRSGVQKPGPVERVKWWPFHPSSVMTRKTHVLFDGLLPTWFEKPSKYMYLCSWDFSWDFLLWNMMIIKYYKVLWWVFCMDYVGTMYVLRIFCIGFCMFLTSPCVEPILVGRRSIAPCCTSTSSDCPTTKTETAMW